MGDLIHLFGDKSELVSTTSDDTIAYLERIEDIVIKDIRSIPVSSMEADEISARGIAEFCKRFMPDKA